LPRLVATDGAIAVNNLDGQIDSLDNRAAERSSRRSLVELLLSRGQFLGRIADYERAATIAEGLVHEDAKDAGGYESRASTYATFHRFDDALADLAEAERRGRKSDELAPARAAIFVATGRLDDAAALRRSDEATMRTMELASAGFLRGEMGDVAGAGRLVGLARTKYIDVSPFPLAWMDMQEGSLLERNGKRAAAKAHYARAVSLLPLYAGAASHLAALSRPSDAVALLEPIAASADDPEVLVQLSDALRRSGRAEDAEKRRTAAIARYDELLARHPAAFADHAATMWLGVGRDPARALPLARANLAVRRTSEAYELALTAALAAKQEDGICVVAREAAALKYATDDLRALAALIVKRCT
jgi:tetratricopeptide (TPR) repeat protein